MKGEISLLVVAIITAVAVIVSGGGLQKMSVVDDCSKLSLVTNYMPYSKSFMAGITVTAGSGVGSYNRVVAIENVPSYATIESVSGSMVFNGNAFGRPTQREAGISYGEFCQGKVMVAYEGDPAAGWVASDGGTMDYTNLGGTYTITYSVKFSEAAYVPTPAVSPSPSPTAVYAPSPYDVPGGTPVAVVSSRIPVISDLADLLRQIVDAILNGIGIKL